MFKIYKLTNLDNGEVYVGHTKQKLNRRLASHKYKATKGISRCSTKHFNYDNVSIECLEQTNITNFEEIRWVERKYMETLNTINKDRPIVTEEEKKESGKKARGKWVEKTGSKTYECECGAKIQLMEKPRHIRSKGHIKKTSPQNSV